MKENHKNLIDQYNKENSRDGKKLETMREVVHKAVAREATDNWRKHIPVYGWIQMNYPSTIQPSLIEKYKEKESLKKKEKEFQNINLKTSASVSPETLSVNKRGSIHASNIVNEKSRKHYENSNHDIFNRTKHKDRLNPDKVNEEVMKESKTNK